MFSHRLVTVCACHPIRSAVSRALRGPRALEELARLLVSTGELTADDLKRLPAKASP